MKSFNTVCREVGYILAEEANKRIKSKTGTYKLESLKPNNEAIIVGQNENYDARIIIRMKFSEWTIIVEVKDKQGYKVIRNEVKDVLVDSITWDKLKKYKQFVTKWKKEIGHFIQAPPDDFMQEVFTKIHDSNGPRLFRESEEQLDEAALNVGDSIQMAKGRATTGPTFTGARRIEKVISMGGKAVAYEVKTGPGKFTRVDAEFVQKYVKPKKAADNKEVYDVGTRIEMAPGRGTTLPSQHTIEKVIRMGSDVQYEVKHGPKRIRVDAKDVRQWVRGRKD